MSSKNHLPDGGVMDSARSVFLVSELFSRGDWNKKEFLLLMVNICSAVGLTLCWKYIHDKVKAKLLTESKKVKMQIQIRCTES